MRVCARARVGAREVLSLLVACAGPTLREVLDCRPRPLPSQVGRMRMEVVTMTFAASEPAHPPWQSMRQGHQRLQPRAPLVEVGGARSLQTRAANSQRLERDGLHVFRLLLPPLRVLHRRFEMPPAAGGANRKSFKTYAPETTRCPSPRALHLLHGLPTPRPLSLPLNLFLNKQKKWGEKKLQASSPSNRSRKRQPSRATQESSAPCASQRSWTRATKFLRPRPPLLLLLQHQKQHQRPSPARAGGSSPRP